MPSISFLYVFKYGYLASFLIFTNAFDEETISQCIENALIPSSTDCYYPHVTSSEAIRQLRDKWIVFMGESTLRQLFLQFLGIIKSKPYSHISDEKDNRKIEERLAGSRYTFYYYEYYDNITSNLTHGPPTLYDGRHPDLLVLNDGLHDLLYNHENIAKSWQNLANTITAFTQKYQVPLMWIPSPQIHDNHLTKHRKTTQWFTNATVYSSMITPQYELYKNGDGYQYYYDVFRNVSYNEWNFDGMHNMERARIESEGFVRALYYINHDPFCGWQHNELSGGQIMTFIFYALITIVVVIAQCLKFLFYKKKAKLKSSNIELQSLLAQEDSDDAITLGLTNNVGGDTHNNTAQHRNTSPKKEEATKTKNNVSVIRKDNDDENIERDYELILPNYMDCFVISFCIMHYIGNQKVYIAFLQMAMCLALLYLFDGPSHFFVSPSLKSYNRDFFIFLHLVLLLISYLKFGKNTARDSDKILSRLQTEEWKGIMQIVFVLYHYFDAGEVYNLIRVFIGAYVWMTGFGNTVFFIKRNNFSLNRLFGMLFRLNWLVFWVCLLLNQPLMLYYICPLHTFFFLFCYTVWGIAHQYNDTKWVKEMKLIVSGCLLVLLFETDASVFDTVWSPLAFLLELHGTLYEWHFRTMLDHYATWMGMIFAVYYDDIYHFLSVTLKNKRISKVIIAVICTSFVVLWYQYVYKHDKFTYNELHPYTESIPIFSYIILRNLYDPLRPYYSSFLAWMGQITLETYIFQYHLYMINDAKSILTVIPNYPLCNFVIVSCFYVVISRIAFDATNTIRNCFYPPRSTDTNTQVLKRTIMYLAIFAFLYIFAFILSLSLQ